MPMMPTHSRSARSARPLALVLAVTALCAMSPAGAAPDTTPMPLVAVNEEYQEWLSQADELLKAGNLAEAIRAYQALVVKGEKVLHPVGKRRFISVSRVAADRIGSLSEEGMKLYRSLYDGQAAKLYAVAGGDLDRSALRRVVAHYFHSSFGDRALDLLGSMQFDRGQYAQAARSWQRVLDRSSPPSLRRERMLAKAAVAWHLAGVGSLRDKRIDELKADFPNAMAVLAGQERNVLAFVRSACKLAAPPAAPRVLADWPGAGGVPDGLAVMADCDVVLTPCWRAPAEEDDVLATAELKAMMAPAGRRPPRTDNRAKASLEGGRLWVRSTVGAAKRKPVAVPCLTEPAVVGSTLLVRTQDRVVARDIITGREIWSSLPLPLVRREAVSSSIRRFLPYGTIFADLGRHGLTVGGDLAFVVGDFLPHGGRRILGRGNQETQEPDDSRLVALRISQQGRLAWDVGRGRGDDEVVAGGKFLCPPTWAGGRVFAVVRFAQSYHLVCLDAGDGGRLLWKAAIGQAPTTLAYGRFGGGAGDRGSPPAVAQGQVFVTTNAGLIAGFNADSGANLWRYQYGQGSADRPRMPAPGVMMGPGMMPGMVPGAVSAAAALAPPNRLIVTKGKVIALPTDSTNVIALNVADGTVAWSRGDDRQRVLSAMSADRILLSGPGMRVLDVADGRVVWRLDDSAGVFGRPAVTKSMILASADGRLLRVHRAGGDSFRTEAIELHRRDALLGNLVSLEAKLVAAAAGTVSVYVGFDEAHAALTDRLKGLTGEALALGRFERGRLSFAAGRHTEALADLKAAGEYAVSAADTPLTERVRHWLGRTYVRLGNHADDDGQMDRWFSLAGKEARTPTERGEMLIRFLRYNERVGRHTEAVRLAQELIDRFNEVSLRDVPIGREADAPVKLSAEGGGVLGDRHIARLIELHGQQVYAFFDARAKAALEEARSAGEPEALLSARQAWPHSRWADHMLLAAAEILYNRRDGDPATLRKAKRILYKLQEYPDSPLTLSGLAGQALIQLRLNPRVAQIVHGSSFVDVEKGTRVKFGDFDGRIDELLLKLAAGGAEPGRESTRASGWIRPPLSEVYRHKDPAMLILRDGVGRPVRIGQRVMLLAGGRVICLDTDRAEYAAAVRWEGLTKSDPVRIRARGASGRRPVLGHLLDDGGKLVVADPRSVTVLDTAGGRVLHDRSLSQMGITRVDAIAADGNRLFFASSSSGGLWAVSVGPDGGLARDWAAKNTGGRGRFAIQAAAGHVLTVKADRLMSCYDARTGEPCPEVGRPVAGRLDAALTDGGMLVVLRGSTLSLHDPQSGAAAPAWQIRLRTATPWLLGVGARHVVLADPTGRLPVRVVDMAHPNQRITVALRDLSGSIPNPVLADFDGDSLILSCGISHAAEPTLGVNTGAGTVGGVAMAAVSLTTGRVAWGPVRLGDDTRIRSRVHPATVTGRHVVVIHKPVDIKAPLRWCILDRATGRMVQEALLPAAKVKGASARDTTARRMALGNPAATDGRMLIETDEGIILMRSGRRQ